MNKIGLVLRKRYLIALSIIGILLILSQTIIQFTVYQQLGDSRVINIAGRQRMLSQKILKSAFGINQAKDNAENNIYLDQLKSSILLWERSHNGLQYGDKEVGLPGRNSASIMSLFSKADKYFQTILDSSKGIVNKINQNNYDISYELEIIKQNEQSFLKYMDEIVFQYDYEAKSKIWVIQIAEIILLILTFIVLMLEVKFIFMPAEKIISNAFNEVEESHESIFKLFEIAPAALFLIHIPDLRVLQMNSLAKLYTNYAIKDDGSDFILNYFNENLESNYEIVSKLINGEIFSSFEAVLKSKDSIKAVLVSSSAIKYNDKHTLIISMTDISRQKQAESVLRKYASTDDLTGLLNRRSGKIIMDNAVERSALDKTNLTVCFCDIDGLKFVNDTLGHEEGDWYIKAISNSIKDNLREDDFAFRYGGDEIILILNNCNEENSNIIIKRIHNSVERMKYEFNKEYNMSISIGSVTYYSKDTTTSDDLIAKADNLMYEEKRRKKAER